MSSFFKSKPATSTSQQNPWEPSQDALKNILSQSSTAFEDAKKQGFISQTGDLSPIYQQYLQQLGGVAPEIKQQTQQAWGQGMGSLGQAGGVYGQAAGGQLAITPDQINKMAGQFVDEGMLQRNIDAATRPITRQLTEQALPGIDRAAVSGGNVGSSRAGIQAAVAERGANEAAMDTAARMRMQAQQDALQRAQTIASGNVQQQMSGAAGLGSIGGQQLGAAQQASGTLMGGIAPYLDQAKLQAMLQGQSQADKIGQRDYMFDLLAKYGNIVTPIGGMGGTTTGTQSGGGASGFSQLMGAAQGAGSLMMGMGSLKKP